MRYPTLLFLLSSFLLLFQAEANSPLKKVCKLSDLVKESSGLIYLNGQIYTHNDSKDQACVYRIDKKNGKVLQWIYLLNAKNMDWEDMTTDGLYVYVGDFGNNNGKHRQRTIYRFQLPKVIDKQKDSVTCETIHFSIPIPAGDANIKFNLHPYDMEAMTIIGDKIIVFTKDWLREHCKAYVLPTIPGHYVAQFIDSFDAKGLVTGACYMQESQTLFLVGYSKHGQGFLYEFKPSAKSLFELTHPRINLSYFAQFEAVCVKDVNTLYLSNEKLPWSTGCLWTYDRAQQNEKIKAGFGNRVRRLLWDFVYWGTHLR
jgi:hypothetical protein